MGIISYISNAIGGLFGSNNDDEEEYEDNSFDFDCNDDADDPAYGGVPLPADEEEEDNEVVPEAVEGIDDLTEVKGIGQTRADAFVDAEFETAADLYFASDNSLVSVNGIGEYTVEQIREDIGSVEDEGNESTESDESDVGDTSSSESESTDEGEGEEDSSDSTDESEEDAGDDSSESDDEDDE